MDRRDFNVLLAGVGLSLGNGRIRKAMASDTRVETFMLKKNGWVPNNERLPVIVYRNFLESGPEKEDIYEALFNQNDWPARWRNGVYSFHHYHSLGHEVLGFSNGSARLMLGGENGHVVTVRGGDIALLPAGTGHCNLGSDEDFTVIGAYPPEQTFDILRSSPTPEQLSRIQTLSFPNIDPVQGKTGPLTREWHTL
ncbi:cupin [Swingsia samuiensis]|uniref:Cupin n=1 Tax=Swingsia samuiensis TaxID=1293412 RepID=A0A4Y6UGQ7_9PROT|nr:cupin [Swingsia samuiensis]QDH16733.1 cupin [Swingsia samuiensis]